MNALNQTMVQSQAMQTAQPMKAILQTTYGTADTLNLGTRPRPEARTAYPRSA